MILAVSTGFIEPEADVPQFKLISPNTVNARIDEMYLREMDKMKEEFESIKYLCATADIWSTKRKSFMGITVHWIDETTLDRKSKVLCCRRFLSPHDSERIAVLLCSIYEEFGLTAKVLCTVTDNASNFVKAFKDFGVSFEAFLSFIADNDCEENADLNEQQHNDHSDENDIPDEENESPIFMEIENLCLTSHFRCGWHTMCRIACADANGAFSDKKYAEKHGNVFSKVNMLYKKTNRPKSSEIIRDVLKVSLILPVKTRWNSMFDSVEHILTFELKTLNTLMLALDLPQFSQTDHEFLGEYLKVVEPIATAVDNLQASNSYYAIFLPTLHSIKYSLDDLRKEKLKHCSPLLKCVREGFERRFARFFTADDEQCIAATIAAVSHPHFKTRWIHEKYQKRQYLDNIRELLVSKALGAFDQSPSENQPNLETNKKKIDGKKFLIHKSNSMNIDIVVFCREKKISLSV